MINFDTTKVLQAMSELWKNQYMDIFFNTKTYEINYKVCDLKDKHKHRRNILNIDNINNRFIITVYSDSRITAEKLKYLILNKLDEDIYLYNFSVESYKNDWFAYTTRSIIVNDKNDNNEQILGNIFDLDDLKCIYLLNEITVSTPYDEMFELNDNDDIQTTYYELYKSLLKLNDDGDIEVTDEGNCDEYSMSPLSLDENGNLCISKQLYTWDNNQLLEITNDNTSITPKDYNILSTLYTENNQNIEILSEFNCTENNTNGFEIDIYGNITPTDIINNGTNNDIIFNVIDNNITFANWDACNSLIKFDGDNIYVCSDDEINTDITDSVFELTTDNELTLTEPNVTSNIANNNYLILEGNNITVL